MATVLILLAIVFPVSGDRTNPKARGLVLGMHQKQVERMIGENNPTSSNFGPWGAYTINWYYGSRLVVEYKEWRLVRVESWKADK